MSTNNCGGYWPTERPWHGGPFPAFTWARYVPPCPCKEIAVNPDTTQEYCKERYSQEELDMRRKAHVLNHSNEGKHTKIARYSYLAKHNSSKVFGSKHFANRDCAVSTRASDVPGKEMFLRVDKNIPLVGINSVRKYSTSAGRFPTKPHLLPDLNQTQDINQRHTNNNMPFHYHSAYFLGMVLE